LIGRSEPMPADSRPGSSQNCEDSEWFRNVKEARAHRFSRWTLDTPGIIISMLLGITFNEAKGAGECTQVVLALGLLVLVPSAYEI
jgi:hypothetical protein